MKNHSSKTLLNENFVNVKFSYKLGCSQWLQFHSISFYYKFIMTTTSLNIFLLYEYFDKFTIGLHFLLISSIFAKFLKKQEL